ncbi:MAG: Na+/H+ antiporter NhaA [Bacteroidota bacterium]|nr:Na+/H+ antiporter NhaA [Bacteroidota bacterium]
MHEENKKQIVDTWIIDPVKQFVNNSTTSGIVLFSSALLALILANSPIKESYHHFWEYHFIIGFDQHVISKSLHHWINDGLMAVFFFVVGLELKREIIAGELSNPKNAILPIAGAIGGMVFPALIFLIFNPSGEASNGWGIPMATDIAFALGVLYLLGNRVPLSVKIFLTALAIADDIGAVLVIAFFYTSNIDFMSLMLGGVFMTVLITANMIGVRNTLFYGIVGIGGLWLAFLLSGVHATIAAVLAAFTIPANAKITESTFNRKAEKLLLKFKNLIPNNKTTVTNDQLHVLEDMKSLSIKALTPLQRLEHKIHPVVAFIIMPIFALANSGVTFGNDIMTQLISPITIGIFFSLLLGKLLGITGMVYLCLKLKLAVLPSDITFKHIIGIACLGAIGFTMSLFISELAFKDPVLIAHAKIGVLSASIVASFLGYYLVKKSIKISKPLT